MTKGCSVSFSPSSENRLQYNISEKSICIMDYMVNIHCVCPWAPRGLTFHVREDGQGQAPGSPALSSTPLPTVLDV